MTVESLMQRCAELGIKLGLKGDHNDRLLVDAPRGTLTEPLKEALAAHKLDLIAILKTGDQENSLTQTRTPKQSSEETERPPAGGGWKPYRASVAWPVPPRRSPSGRTAVRVRA